MFLFQQVGVSYLANVKGSLMKRQELKFKLEEASAKRKELEEMSAKIRDAAFALGNTGQRCSNCHERNNTVRTCRTCKM